jgi:hypothetical protein
VNLLKKIQGLSCHFLFSKISWKFFYRKSHGSVYRLRDHDWLSVHGGLATMGRGGHSEAQEVIMIAQRERGGCQGSHQWRHLEVELQRWSHDDTQQRRSAVLRWRDGFERENRLESGWVRWIMTILSLHLL